MVVHLTLFAVTVLLACFMISTQLAAADNDVIGATGRNFLLIFLPAVATQLDNWAWFHWMLGRGLWALTGELPFGLPGFLRDAHRRGVLRQAGVVYQFRHERVLKQLSAGKD